jgi:hypothetical protein
MTSETSHEYEWHPNAFGYVVMLLFLLALWLSAAHFLKQITEYWRVFGMIFWVFTMLTVPRFFQFIIKIYIDALSQRENNRVEAE